MEHDVTVMTVVLTLLPLAPEPEPEPNPFPDSDPLPESDPEPFLEPFPELDPDPLEPDPLPVPLAFAPDDVFVSLPLSFVSVEEPVAAVNELEPLTEPDAVLDPLTEPEAVLDPLIVLEPVELADPLDLVTELKPVAEYVSVEPLTELEPDSDSVELEPDGDSVELEEDVEAEELEEVTELKLALERELVELVHNDDDFAEDSDEQDALPLASVFKILSSKSPMSLSTSLLDDPTELKIFPTKLLKSVNILREVAEVRISVTMSPSKLAISLRTSSPEEPASERMLWISVARSFKTPSQSVKSSKSFVIKSRTPPRILEPVLEVKEEIASLMISATSPRMPSASKSVEVLELEDILFPQTSVMVTAVVEEH